MHWRLCQLPGSMNNILHAHNHGVRDKDPSCTPLTCSQGRSLLLVRIIQSQESSRCPQVLGEFPVLACKPQRFPSAALSFRYVIKQACSRTSKLWKPITWTLTYRPVKHLCSLPVVLKCKTPLSLKETSFVSQPRVPKTKETAFKNVILKHRIT